VIVIVELKPTQAVPLCTVCDCHCRVKANASHAFKHIRAWCSPQVTQTAAANAAMESITTNHGAVGFARPLPEQVSQPVRRAGLH